MALSVKNLAAQLDRLDNNDAIVAETETNVLVSGLESNITRGLADTCRKLGWKVTIEDSAASTWTVEEIDEAYAPFTLIIEKPNSPVGALRLLTNVGFLYWLGKENDRTHWELAQLTTPFQSYAVSFTPWDFPAITSASDDSRRQARGLVRELTESRLVPVSVNRWLLTSRDNFPFNEPAAATWAAKSARMLMLVLPDQFEDECLKFKGPPKLDLELSPSIQIALEKLEREGFLALQAAVDWVFELDREAEMRHILLATELARCGGVGENAETFIRLHVADALLGARTAYQVQIAGISSDTLKTLSDLRKSVSDDTVKVAEGTRQIVSAIASALAVSVAMIAARLSGSASITVVFLVTAIAIVYIIINVVSGIIFMKMQRATRKAWHPRLYRFLSASDYTAMVEVPTKKADKMLITVAIFAVVSIVLMVLVPFLTEPTTSVSKNQAVPNGRYSVNNSFPVVRLGLSQ